jgi:hypothetical protein
MTATAIPTNAIVIRHATEADICVLTNLAILDSRPELTGPALIAEVAGVPRAALDLRDGSVAADPFFATTDLVQLLRVHAKSVTPKPGVRDALWGRLATWSAAAAPPRTSG